LLLIVVTWTLLILAGYYYYHKPLTVDTLAAPLTALMDVLLALLLLSLFGGLGRVLWGAVRLPQLNHLAPLERATLHGVLGAGAFSLIWLGLAALNVLSAWLAWGILLAGGLLLRRECFAWLAEYRSVGAIWRASRRLEKSLAILLMAMVFYQLFFALSPALKWDALSYHLQLPRLYLEAGGLRFVPENPYWGYAQLTEMLYTFAMALHRAETAAVLGWGLDLLLLLGVLGFTEARLASLRPAESNPETPHDAAPIGAAGWVAAAALMAGYTFRHIFGWSYTDLFSALIGLAAIIAMFEWLADRQTAADRLGWWLAACLFAGFATATKWTAGILVVGLVLVSLFELRAGRLKVQHWILGGLLVALPVLPWLARNGLATGNPLYPYLFATPWMSAERLAEGNISNEPIIWWIRLLLPLSLTWTGVDSDANFQADLGPLLLLFSVFGFWRYWKHHSVRSMALLLLPVGLVMGLVGITWVHLGRPRLYYVMLPVLAAAAGWGWAWLQSQVIDGVRLRRILGAVLVLVIGLSWWADTRELVAKGPVRQVFGIDSRQAYLENNLGWYARAMQTLYELPPDSHTLLLWEARGLYAPLNTQADPWIDRYRGDLLEVDSAAALLALWKDQGITHLMLYNLGLELIRPPDGAQPGPRWTTWLALQDLLPAPVSIGDTYFLYPIP
jgi:hypothetical protein